MVTTQLAFPQPTIRIKVRNNDLFSGDFSHSFFQAVSNELCREDALTSTGVSPRSFVSSGRLVAILKRGVAKESLQSTPERSDTLPNESNQPHLLYRSFAPSMRQISSRLSPVSKYLLVSPVTFQVP